MKKINQIDCHAIARNDSESGRSMVEMMGVLAIMGIIAIGGLAGFRSAMNKMSASKIVEIIGEVSGEAQRRNTCIYNEDLEDDDDFEIPQCVDEIIGAENGQVLITFKEDCAEIENAVGNSFNKCRWEKDEDHTYIYIPNRGRKCPPCPNPEHGCPPCSEECEDYTKSRCFR